MKILAFYFKRNQFHEYSNNSILLLVRTNKYPVQQIHSVLEKPRLERIVRAQSLAGERYNQSWTHSVLWSNQTKRKEGEIGSEIGESIRRCWTIGMRCFNAKLRGYSINCVEFTGKVKLKKNDGGKRDNQSVMYQRKKITKY